MVCIEPNVHFFRKFKADNPRINIKRIKGENFISRGKFDFIVMSLVFHHIPDNNKEKFLNIIQKNLKPHGKVIIGDVFIPSYKNEKERNCSLIVFHNLRIKKAKSKESKLVEKMALKDGLKREGEYKISIENMFELIKKSKYKLLKRIKVGPQKFGGYNILKIRKKS